VIIDAAKKSAFLDPATIQRRNKATDQLLTANKLRSIDVVGDGNCLCRALSVGLRGDESQHFKLRQDTARHFSAKFQVIFGVSSLTATDKDSIHQRACVLATDKEEVGEEAILVAADLLQRNIEVFTSSAKQPPLHTSQRLGVPATSHSSSPSASLSMSQDIIGPLPSSISICQFLTHRLHLHWETA
jgi:hypothetical protein